MSAQKIDVLAVMRLAERNLRNLGVRGNALEVDAAIEAVAELIEAVTAQQDGCFVCQCDECRRVRAALSRIGGAA